MPRKSKRSLQAVVGPETYAVWVEMLRALVPDGRTHRLAMLVAGMLQYAVTTVAPTADNDADRLTVAASLIASTETADPEDVKELLHDVVIRLFKDAGVEYQRKNSRGVPYTIAESIYEEYINWFNMPWE